MTDSISVDPTPNPHSLKFSAETATFIHSGLVSVSSESEASEDPFARSLISIKGVSNVFIVPQFVTITKDPNTLWNSIVPEVQKILEQRLAS